MSQHTIQIELEGLITLLARNLYADPDVFVRELVQNAHDSITRRRELAAERADTDIPAGQIRVRIDRPGGTLVISDNGSGLTEGEIHAYLATIGRSGTDELRQRLLAERARDSSRAAAIELIGQFGIGLLSAFIVADRVEVRTRAAGHPGYCWVSTGSSAYQVTPIERAQVGTEVTLHVMADQRRYLDRARIERIVRTYADFLGVPVYVDDHGDDRHAAPATEPVNAVHAPWHRQHASADDRKQAALAYWDQRFPDEVALDVLAIADSFAPEDASEQPGERPAEGVDADARVHGVLAITDRHVPDVNTRGTVDVYIARMFICSGNRDILPPWARFIQGVLECDQLRPNAARDNIMRDATLDALRAHLGRRIIAWLTELSRTDRDRFVRIMRWHAYHILAMAVQDAHADFFRAVADLVPLTTDRGPLTVPDYLAASPDRRVWYLAEPGSARQYSMLCAARGLCVFDCSEPFAERFLHRYATLWPDLLELHRLDAAHTGALFQPVSEAERAPFDRLVAAYGQLFPGGRVAVQVVRFAPVEVPAVVTETRDARGRRQMQDLMDNPTVPAFLRDMVSDYLDDRHDPVTLHLNADNPIVRRLAAGAGFDRDGDGSSNDSDDARTDDRDIGRDIDRDIGRIALITLYNNALMLSGQTLTAERMRRMFGQYNQLIELVMDLARERTDEP